MKLYTRTGDDGTTGLYGGQRTTKDALRVEAYGAVDELNAALGLAAATCTDQPMRNSLVRLQSRLFDLGADLCTPHDAPNAKREIRITANHVQELEKLIDAATQPLPELKTFVLPGGTELSARLHHARAVARRAERRIVALSHHERIGENVIPFINRVSDLLFAMARLANHNAGVKDVLWTPEA